MGDTFVIIGLRRKYAQTLGALHAATGDRVRIMGDLDHLAHVLRMFSPSEDVAAIQPRRPYKPNRRRMTKTLMDVLRKANRPLKARELARMVMQAEGSDPRDY